MKIEILGTGCYNCVMLETMVNEIINELSKTDIEITRVVDEKRIRHYMPLDQIPGMLIDSILVSVRDLPARETLFEWLSGVSMPDTG